ncbi:hypothetical protein ACHQM5_003659 [Ranunculus cassubicifolius]
MMKLLKKRRKMDSMGKDRISYLPDAILHHILSFLPARSAVCTSALSTKWKYIWTAIFNVDISDKLCYSAMTHLVNPREETKFVKFVENLLCGHDATSIQRFCLSSKMTLEASDVSAWISTLMEREVREIILKINVKTSVVLPCTLFYCESLTVVCADAIIELPSSICLSSLKVLHLEDILISSDKAVQQVSFTFPKLEEFYITDCPLMNINVINIHAPALKKQVIHDDNMFYYMCKVNIYADSLVSLHLISKWGYQISLHNSSTLSKVYVDTYNECRKVDHGFGLRARKFLEGIYNIKDLMLTCDFIRNLSKAGLTKKLLVFTNLIHISVRVHCDGFKGEYLIELLRNLPNIETLLLISGLNLCWFDQQAWAHSGTRSKDFLSHLKSVEIRCFRGKDNELHFVQFLLTHARNLKKVTIISSSALSLNLKRQMLVCRPLFLGLCEIGFYDQKTSANCK